MPVAACSTRRDDALKSVNMRMQAEDLEPEAASESAALAPESASPHFSATEPKLAELRKQLKDHGRRLRELEIQLSAPGAPGCLFAVERGPGARGGGSTRYGGSPTEGSPSRRPWERDPEGSPSVAEEDPYQRMFASAHFNRRSKLFDQDLLMAIYANPYNRKRQQAALLTSGLLGLLSMPFGPMGMVAGAVAGAMITALLGAMADTRKIKAELEDSELEKKRLKSLVRWASERHNEDDDVLKFIEMVTLEFKPMSDIAAGSRNARKLLNLLDEWISRKTVTRHLWIYMRQLVMRWRELSHEELLRSMFFLQTLTVMYRHSSRKLDDQEVQFMHRMERILAHESVKSAMAHAQPPTQRESRVMKAMVCADAVRFSRKILSGRIRSKPHDEEEPEAAAARDLAEDSDEELEHRQPGPGSPTSEIGSMMQTTALPDGKRLVLKKPFFRSWDDFMEFDDTVKHKMPITWSEFNLLLQEEARDTKNQDVCIDRKDLKVAKTLCGPGVICVRAWASLPGVEAHTAFHLFCSLEERTKWDKSFGSMTLVDTGVQGSDVMYCNLKIPGATARDFLQYRRVRVEEDGAITIVLRSAEHPNMPEDSRYIRVESKISGYVFRQDEEAGKPVLRMFLMSCSDVKGMIPKWIVNFVAPKRTDDWLDSLHKAALEYQANHKSTRKEVQSILSRSMANNAWDYEVEEADEASSLLGAVAAEEATTMPSGEMLQQTPSEEPADSGE